MKLPFDGAISAFFRDEAPQAVRDAIASADKREILDPSYPYEQWLKKKDYQDHLDALQIELVKLQADVKASGKRVLLIFEGRDAAGKGGTIKRLRENLNPRVANVVALPKPTDREAGEWYFQRYIKRLPAAGEIAIFDRSWYNRGVVEKVFDFCTPEQRALFFDQVPGVEKMLIDAGIHLVKFWLNISRAEQLRRFLQRERDPLKQWKLSWIDVEGLKRWDLYTAAIRETLQRTHSPQTPWTVIRADDKYRLRLAAIQTVLDGMDYAGKDPVAIGAIDPKICGGPDLWHG
ncbi:UDP-galactose-lipid carrier transferase [Defluviimonas sp. 20V17]|uniref:ADP/GDP-polyphosphate phosphotransferase n=1 Tax=Allgaiera indica TaxID=765699 RepID=A0AAN4UQL0_9RHOB|nr:polyphosphate kinase 2 [Allgaiera indica]KDB02853.1 UDP-galactose-lipid carrier transferase [Defluviimonas sp. 20V17]GHE01360.1 polyphosphate kinase 2 [Allgaiera indica]SDW85423.1 polyphosphate kinase 2, PA0141 family [Allgaiera indica]